MYSQIAANKRKTVLLMALFVVLIGALGWVVAAVQDTPSIFIGVLVFAIVYSLVGYVLSARIALTMSGAKEVNKREQPRLYRAVENLAITAGMPMPKVCIINDPAPNAFATGRKPEDGVVAVTTGLLEMLDDSELEGVVAHELSHIQNYDIRVMAIVLVLVTVIAFISDIFLRMTIWGGGGRGNRDNNQAIFIVIGIVAAIIAPIVATLLKLAVSRRREFLADSSGALLTRYPDGLAGALKKIESYGRPMKRANTATAHLFISNPLGKGKATKKMAKLFSTHPPTQERVAALEKMGRQL